MEKRVLAVKDTLRALALMKSMLAANMIDNDLVESASDSLSSGDVVDENGCVYHLKLVWLKRGDGDLVGCPCFVCPFKGFLPNGMPVDTLVYVKAFSSNGLNNCKMHLRGEELEQDEIVDGSSFKMTDEKGRYPDEEYVYRDGIISLKA